MLPKYCLIDGNYLQGSAGNLSIELGGFEQGTEFDFLDISGTATLSGTLTISLLDGFMPATTDTFTFLKADGGLFGTFDDVINLDGSLWSITYFPNQIGITLIAIPEPGACSLMALGALCLVLRQQRSLAPVSCR